MPCTRMSWIACVALAAIGCEEDASSDRRNPLEPPEPTPAVEASLEEGACLYMPFGAAPEDYRCGRVTVPENRGKPLSRRSVSFPFAVLKAQADQPSFPPSVVFPGGPGSLSIQGALEGWRDPARAPLRNRDQVFFDPRGVETAEPSLDCPEYTEQSLSDYGELDPTQEGLVSALRACHDRWRDAGIDLGAYSSADIVADALDLMRLLGYQEFDVRGASYGSHYVQTIIRLAPERVRSAILDSVVPVSVPTDLDIPRYAQRAFRALSAACAKDAACSAAMPDLDATLYELAAELNRAPIPMRPTNPRTQQAFDLVLDGRRFLGGLQQRMYDPTQLPTLPASVSQVLARNAAQLKLIEASAGAVIDTRVDVGAHWAMKCADRPRDISRARRDEAVRDVDPVLVDAFDDRIQLQDAVCAFWDVEPAQPMATAPVESDIPALVWEGEYDPITPPDWGDLVAETLSNATVLRVRAVGHGAMFSPTPIDASGSRCQLRIAQQFLDDPHGSVDSSCLDELPALALTGPYERK